MIVVIWEINDYAEMGGGTYYDKFSSNNDEIGEAQKFINEKNKEYGERFTVLEIFGTHHEYKATPVEKVTDYEIEAKR